MTAKHRAPSRRKQKRRLPKARKASFMGSVPLLFSIAVLLAGLVWGGSTLVISIAEKQELAQSGVQASATVTKHHKKTVPSSRTKSVYSLIDYTFTPGHLAEEHATGVELPSDLWNTVEAGSTIAVTYNPTSPSTNQPTMILDRLSPTAASSIRLLVGVLLLALFTWLSCVLFRVATSRRRKSKAIDLGTHGTATGPAKNHGAKQDVSKARETCAQIGMLAILALMALAILAVFFCVFVGGIELVGPLVVDLIQNTLL
jgi:cytoskeletal protein RodZ